MWRVRVFDSLQTAYVAGPFLVNLRADKALHFPTREAAEVMAAGPPASTWPNRVIELV